MPKQRNQGNQDRIKTFVQAYFYGKNGSRFNAAESAKLAGYGKIFSEKKAYRLVGDNRDLAPNKAIYDACVREREKIKSKTTITREDLLEGYKREIEYDPAEFYDENGDLIPIHKLPKELTKVIQGIKHGKHGIEYKLPSKRANRKDLVDWLYTERKDDKTTVDVSLKWAVFPAAPQSLEQWQTQTNSILNANNNKDESTPTLPAGPTATLPADSGVALGVTDDDKDKDI